MKKWMKLFLVLPFLVFSIAVSASSSQIRLPNEPYQQAYQRIKNSLGKEDIHTLVKSDSPFNKKVPVDQMDFSDAVTVGTHEELIHMFNTIRDSRFLYEEEYPDFARRISWLFPDDGCYARATVAGMKLHSDSLPRPSKVFAFGDLEVATPFAPPYSTEHTVSWWYHVAPVVVYMGTAYVLDPALNSNGPMLVDEWFGIMGANSGKKGAVCNSYSYNPFDSCSKATAISDLHAMEDQRSFLEYERKRVETLGFDSAVILGKTPPWYAQIPQVGS